MPMILDKNPSIISVYGIDIIYYIKNLYSDLKIEFKNYNTIYFYNIKYIYFWISPDRE